MKYQTINTVKFKALSRRLSLPFCWTVGLLESLWLFACHNARDGLLRRVTPLELAGWLEYPGDENELVDALVETRWLDRDEGGELSIHDWDHHKPNWLKALNKQTGETRYRSEPRSNTRSTQTEPSNEPSNELNSGLSDELSSEQRIPPPIPPPTQDLNPYPYPEPLSEEWGDVARELAAEGMEMAIPACESARNRGCLSSEVRRMVEFWRARKSDWSVGLLYKRVAGMRPETNYSQGWPPCPEFDKQLASEERERRQQEASRTRRVANVEREQNAAAVARLESEFGEQLNKMSSKQRRELCQQSCPALEPMLVDRKRPKGLVRQQLLVALESVS